MHAHGAVHLTTFTVVSRLACATRFTLVSTHYIDYYSIQINFNMGADGSPWVWVMGEHKDDLSYKELVSPL